MWRTETRNKFIPLKDYALYLSGEEKKLYEILNEKELTKTKIKELEAELKRLKNKVRELQDPEICKGLWVTKQSVFIKRLNLINKLKRLWKKID